jgi:thiazole synthase/sulfur carrier protein
MISLQINGKPVELERATPLLDYIEKLGVDPRAVAVEHNGTILERAAYETITLNQGDTVEIVRMVGGGRIPAFAAECGFHGGSETRIRQSTRATSRRSSAKRGAP